MDDEDGGAGVHAEQLGVFGARRVDRIRLERLVGDKVELFAQHGIERVGDEHLQVGIWQSFAQDVCGLQPDWLAVAEAKAAQAQHLGVFGNFQRGAHDQRGSGELTAQRRRVDPHAERSHLFAEAGQTSGACDDAGATQECASTMLAIDETARFQIAQRVPHGDPAHAEQIAQFVLAGQLCTLQPYPHVDALADRLLDLVP